MYLYYGKLFSKIYVAIKVSHFDRFEIAVFCNIRLKSFARGQQKYAIRNYTHTQVKNH